MKKEGSAEIRYLNHSGFSVETGDRLLIFDYFPAQREEWEYPAGKLSQGVVDPAVLPKKKTVVFSSHSHHDHFDSRILDWRNTEPEIAYVLSRDIRLDISDDHILILGPRETTNFEGLEIRTLRSTDEGVAFLIKVNGLCIYHAGDLNWWHWNGETDSYNREMGENYREEIDSLIGECVDLAFIPADPRLEENYLLGLRYFMETVGAKMVFPMHFWGDFSVFPRLAKDFAESPYRDKIVVIRERGELFRYHRD